MNDSANGLIWKTRQVKVSAKTLTTHHGKSWRVTYGMFEFSPKKKRPSRLKVGLTYASNSNEAPILWVFYYLLFILNKQADRGFAAQVVGFIF